MNARPRFYPSCGESFLLPALHAAGAFRNDPDVGFCKCRGTEQGKKRLLWALNKGLCQRSQSRSVPTVDKSALPHVQILHTGPLPRLFSGPAPDPHLPFNLSINRPTTLRLGEKDACVQSAWVSRTDKRRARSMQDM